MTTAVAETLTLDDRIAAASDEIASAECAAGAAVLDGGNEHAAGKRVANARAALVGLEAARDEQASRDAAERERERERQEAIARWRYLSRHLAYVQRLRPVLELRAELVGAEAAVMALPAADGSMILFEGTEHPGLWLSEMVDSGKLPEVNLPRTTETGRFEAHPQRRVRAEDGGLTVADCAEWEKRLKPLVAAAAEAIGDATPDALLWEVK
jgi:hypothetical protein